MRQEIVQEDETPRSENSQLLKLQRTSRDSVVANDATRLKTKEQLLADVHRGKSDAAQSIQLEYGM